MKILTVLLALGMLITQPVHRLHAADTPAEPATNNGFVEILPAQKESVDRALAWLAKNQNKDGSWGSEGGGGTYTMAMTGLAGLSLLSAGNAPGRGKYGSNVTHALQFVMKHQDRDGLITSPGNDGQQMYGHGFALTFMAECYGMDPSSELGAQMKDGLQRAVKKTGQAQSGQGGWYYSPNSGADEGSVTITQVQALRAARNAGIDVPEKVLTQAINYVKKSQNPDGGIRYSLSSGQTSSVALSAAGAEVFLMAGQYDTKETKRVCDYLKKNMDSNRTQGYHDFYTNFYGTQAMFQIGGDYWTRYYSSLRDRLIKAQGTDGSWRGDVGSTYSTAIAVMILSLPYRYLPIFQK